MRTWPAWVAVNLQKANAIATDASVKKKGRGIPERRLYHGRDTTPHLRSIRSLHAVSLLVSHLTPSKILLSQNELRSFRCAVCRQLENTPQ